MEPLKQRCYPARPMSSNAGMSTAPDSPSTIPSQSPLAIRDFRVYWIGQLISLVGMWTQMVAQGWVITELTDKAATFGWLQVISSIPMSLLIMPAGVVADRFDRRKILIVTQVCLAAVAFVFAALIHGGHLVLAYVYVIAAVSGSIAAFDFPAQSALVPQLVPPPLIPKAIGLNQAIFHGSRFLGPAVAALLMWLWSPAAAFLANGLSYFAVIYSLSIIKSRPVAAGASARKPGKGGMGEGLAYVRSHPVVLALIGLTGLVTAFIMPINIVFMPIIARDVFHADKTQFGIVMAASGLGAVIGSVGMMRVPAVARGKVIVGMVATATLGILTLSFARSAYVAAPIMLVTSLSTSTGLGLAATTIQVVVPEQLRGRVMGIYGMTFVSIMPPFALLWGYVADATSLPGLLRGLGLAFGVTALSLLAATGIWSMNPVAAHTGEGAPKAASA